MAKQPRVNCPNGHSVPVGIAFCGTCGAPMAPPSPPVPPAAGQPTPATPPATGQPPAGSGQPGQSPASPGGIVEKVTKMLPRVDIESTASGSGGDHSVRVQSTRDGKGKTEEIWIGAGGYEAFDLGGGQVLIVAPGQGPAGGTPVHIAKTDKKGLLVCTVQVYDRESLRLRFAVAGSQADTAKAVTLRGRKWQRPVDPATNKPVGFWAALASFTRRKRQ